MSTQTQRKYKVIREDNNQAESQENEIRVRKEGNCRVYINRAAELLLRNDNRLDSITISAIGQAIPIALVVAERIKEKISGLHTLQRISNVEKKITYEPLEQGLDRQTVTRYNASFKITLSRSATQAERQEAGYQEARKLDKELTLDEIINFKPQNRQFRNFDNRNRNYDDRNRNFGNRNFQDRRSGQSQRRGADRREKRYDQPRNNQGRDQRQGDRQGRN